MFLREHAGRQYLFIGDNSTQHFTVVDVTEPDDPNIIEPSLRPRIHPIWVYRPWESVSLLRTGRPGPPNRSIMVLLTRPGWCAILWIRRIRARFKASPR